MRKFVNTALVATALCATASAQVSIPGSASVAQGVGSTASTSFQITATIGSACIITKPSDVTASGTLYWTQQNTPASSVGTTSATSFSVACNSLTNYTVALGSSTLNLTSSIGTTTYNYSVGTLIAGSTSAVAQFVFNATGNVTTAGINYTPYTIDITFPIPDQSLPSGTHTGEATVTLTVN